MNIFKNILLGLIVLCLGFVLFSCGQSQSGSTPSSSTPVTPTPTPTPTTTSTYPVVSTVSPTDEATGVLLTSEVTVTFDSTMDASTITTSTFTLTSPEGVVSGTITTASTSLSVTFTPSASFAYGTVYTVEVSTAVKDISGVSLEAAFSSSFTSQTLADATNAIGNGATIISGPSGPSAEDNDRPFRSLSVHPTNSNILIIGTERNGFVKSMDGGVNWSRYRYGLRSWSDQYPEIYDLAIATSDPNIVYAATLDSPGPLLGDYPSTYGGVYKSTDGGQTWARKTYGLTCSNVGSIWIDKSNPDIAVVGVRGGTPSFSGTDIDGQLFPGGMFRTTDGGETWSKVTINSNDIYNAYYFMRPASSTTNTIYCVGYDSSDSSRNVGHIKSTNGGTSWSQIASPLRTRTAVPFDISADALVMYTFSSEAYDVMKSTDDGATWPTSQNIASYPYAMAVSPADSDRILFADKNNLYLSTDGLLNVVSPPVVSGLANTNYIDDIVFAPSDPTVVYFVTAGYLLYQSTDSGASFSLVKNIRSDVLNVIP